MSSLLGEQDDDALQARGPGAPVHVSGAAAEAVAVVPCLVVAKCLTVVKCLAVGKCLALAMGMAAAMVLAAVSGTMIAGGQAEALGASDHVAGAAGRERERLRGADDDVAAAGVAQDTSDVAYLPLVTRPVAQQVQLSDVGRLIGGSARAVAVRGVDAYVGFDRQLVVFDVGDESSPLLVASTELPDLVTDIEPVGDLLYVALGGVAGPESPELVVVDVSDRGAPKPGAAVDAGTYADASALAFAGGHVFLACGDGLHVFDVSDPGLPRHIGFLGTDYSAQDIEVAGDFAFVATGVEDEAAFVVIDVSDPSSPALAGVHPVPGIASSVYVADGTAYVNSGDSVRAFDVRQPTAAREVGAVALGSDVRAVGGSYDDADHVLYAMRADFESGRSAVAVIDRSDPSALLVLGASDMPPRALASRYRLAAPRDGHVFIAAGDGGLRVVDARRPESPAAIGSFEVIGDADDVAVAGRVAYVADWRAGLRVVDLAVPEAPRVVGTSDGVMYAKAVSVADGHAYVAATSRDEPHSRQDFMAFDVSSPREPRLVATVRFDGGVIDLAVVGRYAHVVFNTSDGDAMAILDLADPASPREVGSLRSSLQFASVAAAGDLAFIGLDRQPSGLMVVDVSDATTPAVLGSVIDVPPGNILDLVVDGDRVLAAAASDKLQVFDVSDPAAPRLAASVEVGESVAGVAADGAGNAYVSSSFEKSYGVFRGSLSAFFVPADGQPRLLSQSEMPSVTGGVDVDGDLAVTACDSAGLVISRIGR